MSNRIENLPEIKLVGKRMTMSYSDNKTPMLWQSFMPRRKEIPNCKGSHLFSVQVYNVPPDFKKFNAHTEFEKWAAVEVTDFNHIPEGMEPYTLKGGLYAVFMHVGGPATFMQTFNYIYNTWLPQSGFQVDHREHFEILGEKYKHGSPDAEEEIWIPIAPCD